MSYGVYQAIEPLEQRGPIGERYHDLENYRITPLAQGRSAAELTIPRLLPPSGSGDYTSMVIPYQSLGARGVQYLSGKLTTSLMPPGNSGTFTLSVNEEALLADLGDAPGPDSSENKLIDREEFIHKRLNESNIRLGLSTAIQHAIISGNLCVYIGPDLEARVYRLDQFVVNRQPDGTLLEVIVHDRIDARSVPESVSSKELTEKRKVKNPGERLVDLYTRCVRRAMYEKEGHIEGPTPETSTGDSAWVIQQEVAGMLLNETTEYDNSPFIVARWSVTAGEHYGRGLVEELLGDLRTYEGLNKSILEASAAGSRVVFMVQGQAADSKDLSRALNGEFVTVRDPQGVIPLQADLRLQLSVAQTHARDVEQRLQAAFLMTSAFQRQAERVTATEIRAMSSELEAALGGVYTSLSQELLAPIIRIVMEHLSNAGEIPDARYMKANVLTGFSALGREQELQRIQGYIQTMSVLGEAALSRFNIQEISDRAARAYGLNPERLTRSEQDIQQAQTTQTAADSAAGSLGNIAEQIVTDGQFPLQQ